MQEQLGLDSLAGKALAIAQVATQIRDQHKRHATDEIDHAPAKRRPNQQRCDARADNRAEASLRLE